MCGIFGYTGNENAAPILLAALARLEYRGYDSAGIATVHNGSIHAGKDKGKLSDVIAGCKLSDLPGNTGIGHVRWATHGGVTKCNAHPHLDQKNEVAVVHNGIIENYNELRTVLSKKYHFASDTDTEVIPHLIREKLDCGLDFAEAFFAAVSQLEGSFAILAVAAGEPGRIYAARRDSPMVIGLGDKTTYIGSDVISFLPYTRRAVFVEDGETVIISNNDVKIFNAARCEVVRPPTTVNLEWNACGKGDFDHFMLKEIEEQPSAIRRSIVQDSQNVMRMVLETLRARDVIFTACGSSRFAALIGRYAFSQISSIFSDVVLASEFGYFSGSLDKNTRVIAISQSGETADVLDGVRQAKAKGAGIFSIVNTVGSSLARLSDRVMYLNCGPEIGVAATKSFITEVSVLYLFAYAMDGRLEEGQAKLHEIAGIIERDLPRYLSEIPLLAEKLKRFSNFYYLARGINFAMACEGALKLKEIAYVHAEGMAAGELKHGTLALIEEGTPVVAICPSDYTFAETIANIEEAKARGAYVIGVSDISNHVFDEWIKLPRVEEVLYPLVTAVPLQLLAYYSAVCRGLDPDKPRNLAKSVTVK